MSLTKAQRKAIPKSEMGLPNRPPKSGDYPTNTWKRAIAAKSYSKQEEEKGRLTKGQKKKIDAKANAEIKRTGGEKSKFKGKIESRDHRGDSSWNGNKERSYKTQKNKKK